MKWFKQFPAAERRVTIPTMLTLVRIALIPCIVAAILWQWWMGAFILFCIAALTDAFDGLLARWLNQRTFLGACLDPLADKLLMIVFFFTLAFVPSPFVRISVWFPCFILIKELLVMGGAAALFLYKGRIRVEPHFFGKMAAAAQMIFAFLLITEHLFAGTLHVNVSSMMYGISLVVFISLIQYTLIGIRQFRSH